MSESSYWNSVYAAGKYVRGEIPRDSSPFALAALPALSAAVAAQVAAQQKAEEKKSIVLWEWGCGNGRDALFFAREGLRVVGTDIADVSIDKLNREHSDNKKLVFLTQDFTNEKMDPESVVAEHFARDGVHKSEDLKAPTHAKGDSVDAASSFVVGAIYSRFTIHSVKYAAASSAYRWAWAHLNSGGLLCIETRSVKDTLCGVGTQVEGERNAWIEDHYRRFTVASELKAELEGLGFVIEHQQEDTGLAVYKEEDPCVLRIFAMKP